MKLSGRDEPALGMAPAQQRLDADHRAVLQPHDRLVVQLELLGGERALQVGAQLQAGEHALVHGRLEQAVAALAVALGDVHRGVGVADHLVGVGAGLVLGDRDAEAAAQRDLLVAGDQRHGERLEDPLGGVGRLLAVLDVLEQHRELVAAEARGGVGAADALVETARHLDQHLVAGGVPEAVVDRLEVVEVEEDHGEPAPLAPAAGDRVAHALGEQRAVGEPRHAVVEGLVGELLLEHLALADVAAVEHDAADVLVLEQVGHEDLERALLAVPVHEHALDRLDVLGVVGDAGGDEPGEPAAVAGLDQLLEVAARDLLGRVAEHALDRRALVGDLAAGAEHRDEVARVLDERAEARLAAPPVHLLGERDAVERERHLRGQRPQRGLDGRSGPRRRRRRRAAWARRAAA